MRNLKTVAAETGIDLATVRKVAAALSKNVGDDPEMVVLRHPKLPPEQVIEIDRRRIGARLAAGWEEVDPAPEPTKPEPVKPAEQESTPTESASKRRSRKSTEEQ